MFSLAQSQQKKLLESAWQGRVSELRSWMNPLPTSPTAANSPGLTMGTFHGAVLLALRLGRFEELGDDLDREHAVDPPFGIDDSGVLGLALEQVGERIAHDVVAVEQRPKWRVGLGRHRLGAEVALGE